MSEAPTKKPKTSRSRKKALAVPCTNWTLLFDCPDGTLRFPIRTKSDRAILSQFEQVETMVNDLKLDTSQAEDIPVPMHLVPIAAVKTLTSTVLPAIIAGRTKLTQLFSDLPLEYISSFLRISLMYKIDLLQHSFLKFIWSKIGPRSNFVLRKKFTFPELSDDHWYELFNRHLTKIDEPYVYNGIVLQHPPWRTVVIRVAREKNIGIHYPTARWLWDQVGTFYGLPTRPSSRHFGPNCPPEFIRDFLTEAITVNISHLYPLPPGYQDILRPKVIELSSNFSLLNFDRYDWSTIPTNAKALVIQGENDPRIPTSRNPTTLKPLLTQMAELNTLICPDLHPAEVFSDSQYPVHPKTALFAINGNCGQKSFILPDSVSTLWLNLQSLTFVNRKFEIQGKGLERVFVDLKSCALRVYTNDLSDESARTAWIKKFCTHVQIPPTCHVSLNACSFVY